jgi:Domain of unknown function (DUF1854)
VSEVAGMQPARNAEVVVLDPAHVQAWMNEKGRLEVRLPDGSVHTNARVTLAFPISRPKRFIYLVAEDGTELGVIAEPRRMERETRDLLLDQADQAYFMPRITRVLHINEEMGIARWEVETDRGWSAFDVVARSESHWYVGRNKVVVRDADGNRYLIEDLTALDGRSRRMLDLYL